MSKPKKKSVPARLKHELPDRSRSDLKMLVMEISAGGVFLSNQLGPNQHNLLPTVFLPIAFGAFDGWTKKEIDQIGVLYAYYNEALPRSINGLPIFADMYLLNKNDWAKVQKAVHITGQVISLSHELLE